MVSLSEEVTIPSPPEVVWPLLAEPTLVASCVPGASLTPSAVVGVYQGTMRVKLGPTVATFRGEARVAYDYEARRCTVEGRGIDERGQSRAVASGVVSARGGDTTVVKVEGSFNVTGPLEGFANVGGVHVARLLLAEFAQNMAKLLTTEGTPAPEAGEIPLIEPQTVAQQARAAAFQEQAPPASGGSLLRRAFRQALPGKGRRKP